MKCSTLGNVAGSDPEQGIRRCLGAEVQGCRSPFDKFEDDHVFTREPLVARARQFHASDAHTLGRDSDYASLQAHLPELAGVSDSQIVGESWELSLDPSFPSNVFGPDGERVLLSQVLAESPGYYLGARAQRDEHSTPMLIKLLDAADALSVQVHPADDHPGLADDESGKPEAWIILESSPGAGIYLGFREGIERDTVAALLARGGDISPLLNFVEVQPGDAFVIEPGLVHAIGPGVTLLEPQLVRPGRRGVTYRFFDWQRRYNSQGQLDPQGQARALHIQSSLEVTRFAPIEARRSPELLSQQGQLRHELVLTLQGMQVEALSGRGKLSLPRPASLMALIVITGEVSLSGVNREPLGLVQGGQSVLIPAGVERCELELDAAKLYLIWMEPDA